jgi:hypothetical protein
MLDTERVARNADLLLTATNPKWSVREESPHIWKFSYEIATPRDSGESFQILGSVDGYRIVHDWTVESDLDLWDEANALDPDIVEYVDSLIRELRACEAAFNVSPSLTNAQRVLIVRHVEAAAGVDSPSLIHGTVASLAMMDAPVIVLADPWPMPNEQATPAGVSLGRKHIASLRELGFVTMVGSRFVWAWNAEMDESWMSEYSYEKLLAAKQAGELDAALKSRLADEVRGLPLPDDALFPAGTPKPGTATEDS